MERFGYVQSILSKKKMIAKYKSIEMTSITIIFLSSHCMGQTNEENIHWIKKSALEGFYGIKIETIPEML